MMPTQSPTPSRVPPYVLMVVVALAVRLAVIPFLYHDWMDPFVLKHWAFGLIARSIASGHGFGSPFADTGLSALLPPVYSYLLAGIFRIFGIETKASVIAALSLNSLFSALTCIPVFLIAKRAFADPVNKDRVAKWAGWGWAFSPYGVYYGADWAWSTCLVALELAWLFYFAWRLEKSSRARDWLAYGALSGVAALTEPVVLSVLPLLGLWTIFRIYRHNRPWRGPLLAAALGGIAVLSPWIVRNYEIFHRFIPVRSGFGLELYIGNNGFTGHWINRSLHPNHNDAELSEYERVGEIAYMDHKLHQGEDFIRTHKAWFAWMTFRRIVYMWTGYWSLDRAYLQDEPLDPPNIFVNTTLSVLAFLGLWRIFRLDRQQADRSRADRGVSDSPPNDGPLGVRFAIVLLFFPLTYYVTHPETYYFRPVDPLIAVLAAVAVVSLLPRRKASVAGG